MYEQPYGKLKDGPMPQIPVPGEVRDAGSPLRALLLLLQSMALLTCYCVHSESNPWHALCSGLGTALQCCHNLACLSMSHS